MGKETVVAKIELLKEGVQGLRLNAQWIEDHVSFLETVEIRTARPGNLKEVYEITGSLHEIWGKLDETKKYFNREIPKLQALVKSILSEYEK